MCKHYMRKNSLNLWECVDCKLVVLRLRVDR